MLSSGAQDYGQTDVTIDGRKDGTEQKVTVRPTSQRGDDEGRDGGKRRGRGERGEGEVELTVFGRRQNESLAVPDFVQRRLSVK